MPGDNRRKSVLERVGSFAQARSGWVIAGGLVLTLLLVLPILYLAPEGQASMEPGGQVFQVREEVGEKLPPSTHAIFFIAEARGGDILTQKALWELYQNQEQLRRSELGETYLYRYHDVSSSRSVQGVYTIADAVKAALESWGTTLEKASDEQVKLAIHHLLADPRSSGLEGSFSVKARREKRTILGQQIDYWQSPALSLTVVADNEKLGGGLLTIAVGGGPTVLGKERFNRQVQALLRGEQEHFQLWGVAIDINLESRDEGQRSFGLVIATVLVILAVVATNFRSWRETVLVALGLGMLIIWMKGISNLIGLRSSLILDLVLPIAILSLGVDYAIHSLHRYREERERGAPPFLALRRGIGGVGTALILATLTTMAAFLSNTTSGIEFVIGFGIAAAVAMAAALGIMGLFIPALKMRLDARRGPRAEPKPAIDSRPERGHALGRVVTAIADRRLIVLPLVAVLSGAAVFYALKLEPSLDAKEFFSPRSSFVVSLDKLEEHVGERGGEPATIYVKGDLSRPEALVGMRNLIRNMNDDRTVARDREGRPNVESPNIFQFLDSLLKNDYARAEVETFAGVKITDADGDGIPDTPQQLRAMYDYMVRHGIPLERGAPLYAPERIKESFFHDPSGKEEDATQFVIGIPGTREQTAAKESRRELEEDMKALKAEGISFYALAGSAYARDATLDAIANSLNRSIVTAFFLCLAILLVAFRSLRYAIVTIIPVVLVATWLYAFMYLAGLHLNVVTAIIAALSIGVGIDYSIYMAQRFRQELAAAGTKRQALEQAARGSGSALFGSAASSILGFAVMALAPMPMFSSFGLLMALMILMALVAALLVLPCLLMLVAGKGSAGQGAS